MKLIPEDHEDHSVYGEETVHYAGTLYVHAGDWWVGSNQSDADLATMRIDGCHTCDVEFEDDEEGHSPPECDCPGCDRRVNG